ncbi:MAG: hypothetical protein AAFX58_11850, partial [Pseudomonadota bacterium]
MHRCVIVAVLAVSLSATAAAAQSDSQNRTVIGPRNVLVADGIAALRDGDAERAIELFKLGLNQALSDRDFAATLSNLCAAYILLRDYAEALIYCNRSIETNNRSWRAYNNRALANLLAGNLAAAKADIDAGLAISPEAGNLKRTRQMYEDVVNPVEGEVTIDDRRLPIPGRSRRP